MHRSRTSQNSELVKAAQRGRPNARKQPPRADAVARLLLEDGTELRGRFFGARRAVAGEVVFNTGMTGYVEALTDPSYRGQILVLTYPLIGNYGVPSPRRSGSTEGPYESGHIQVQGLVVQHYVGAYSHQTASRPLADWLVAEDVPAITGIDTRTLTERLREAGTMKGWVLPSGVSVEEARQSSLAVDMPRVFDLVAPSQTVRHVAGQTEVLLVDMGAKDNIVRSLVSRGATVVRTGWRSSWIDLARNADGVVLGNGPGDPKDLAPLIAQVREFLGWYRKPVFGICLGHQVVALAIGGDTYKLKYGHRSANQPVQDLLTRRCYVTSQNHGFAVRDGSLPDDWEPWFVNLNDGTNEGMRSVKRPFSTVQFHPEASPGPRDTAFLFDDFLRRVTGARNG